MSGECTLQPWVDDTRLVCSCAAVAASNVWYQPVVAVEPDRVGNTRIRIQELNINFLKVYNSVST